MHACASQLKSTGRGHALLTCVCSVTVASEKKIIDSTGTPLFVADCFLTISLSPMGRLSILFLLLVYCPFIITPFSPHGTSGLDLDSTEIQDESEGPDEDPKGSYVSYHASSGSFNDAKGDPPQGAGVIDCTVKR